MPARSSLRPRVVARRARNAARRIERRLPGRAAVLAYHRVATLDVDPWELAVSPDHFAEQLTIMCTRGTVRRLDELLGDPATARVRDVRAQFAITFDDGYVDNLEAALPILTSFDAPMTVFIAPGLLGRSSYWWDVLSTLVLGSGLEPRRVLAAAQDAGVLDDGVQRTQRTPAPCTTCSTAGSSCATWTPSRPTSIGWPRPSASTSPCPTAAR